MSVRPPRTIAILIPTLVALSMVAVVWRSGVSTEEMWAEMRNWADDEAKRFDSRSFERPVLWGDAGSGLVWNAYDEALALSEDHYKEDEFLLAQLGHGTAQITEEQISAVRRRWRPALDRMRVGAHRTDARPPTDWVAGYGHPTMNLLHSRALINAARHEATQAIESGHYVEAVKMLLDAAAFAVDMSHRVMTIDEMIGVALMTIATHDALPDEVLRGMPREALEYLRDGLAVVDHLTASHAPSVQRNTVMLAFYAQGPVGFEMLTSDDRFGSLLDRARYGFSERRMIAGAVHELIAGHRELVRTRHLRWPDRRVLIDEVSTSLRESSNPLARCVGSNIFAVEESKRHCVAKLRLLRMAVAYHLEEPLPELADPLGQGALRADPAEPGMCFSSEFRNPGRLTSIERLARRGE